MIIVDTSIWIDVLKDKTGTNVTKFRKRVEGEVIVFNRFVQLELLQGAKNETEWKNLYDYLETQYYLETKENTWSQAAKIYYDLRKTGITIRSSIDCCIAQIAIENQALLLHKDKDFTEIAKIRPLMNELFRF
jgi:predicted nucleic acid-binding protein